VFQDGGKGDPEGSCQPCRWGTSPGRRPGPCSRSSSGCGGPEGRLDGPPGQARWKLLAASLGGAEASAWPGSPPASAAATSKPRARARRRWAGSPAASSSRSCVASPSRAGRAVGSPWLTRARLAAAEPRPARRPREGVAMAEERPGPPGSSNHGDRPGQPPTEPLGGPAQPPQPPPAYGQPGSDPRLPGPTAPLPGDPPAPPAFAAAGPPREALAGFWRRLVSAFLDWLLVGIAAAAIGDLFGVEGPRRPRPTAMASSSARSFWSSWLTSPTSTQPAPASRSATRSWGSGSWTPTPAAPCPMPARSPARS
jgi:hypothetical protein